MQIPGYRFIRKINHGGMSTVYLAIQESVGRVVALKVMSPALNSDPSYSERFQREANIVGQLSHPHIVSIYDIGRHNNYNYIAMDYLPGGSIHDKMMEGINAQQALKILKEIGSALDHAHERGYIHRDIKPENILFRDDGSAVLTDFGVARALSIGSRATHAGTVVGTPHYMSPEQTRGKPLDGRSDLYSLGIVFYEMLTGSVPYQGEEAVAIALKHLAAPLPTLPAQYIRFQPILDKLLNKEADKRYQSGRELVADIEMLQLQMRDQGEDFLSGNASLSRQFVSLFSVMLRKTRSRLSEYSTALWQLLTRIRFSRERGFYLKENSRYEVNEQLTRQNTLIATQVHRQYGRGGWLSQWRLLPASYRWALAGACALFLLALTLLFWQSAERLPSEAKGPINGAIAAAESSPETGRQEPAAIEKQDKVAAAEQTGWEMPASPPIDQAPEPAVLPQAPSSEPDPTETAATETSSPAGQTDSSRPAETAEAQDLPSPVPAAENGEQAAPAGPSRFALTVETRPAKARVRIMNIREKYTDGIKLKPGRYHIEVTAPGYRKYLKWIRLGTGDMVHKVSLEPGYQAGDEIADSLASGGRAPVMVVVPQGSFTLGGPDKNSQPYQTITFTKPFAVSKYEVTFKQYERFAQRESLPLPGDNKWGRDDRPVINVSWEEASEYALWLSRETGEVYRLPSEAEWEYVAKAGTNNAFWWGNNVREAAGKANCRRYCDSEFTGVFRSKTAPVGSFLANPFGVYDTAGNVAEWTADCYRDNYRGAAKNGRAYDQDNCPARVIRGGSMKDNAQDIAAFKRRFQPQHTLHEDVGIRLVRELR